MSWQRIESSTVDPAVADGLAARIADPLWLLARQWQVGEFRGEDAANPLFVRLRAQSVEVDRWQVGPPGGDGAVFTRGTGGRAAASDDTPLEAAVEAEPHAAGAGAARVAAEAAHLLTQALRQVEGLDERTLGELLERLRKRFPLTVTADGQRRDVAGERRLALLARTAFDGTALAVALGSEPKTIELATAGLASAVAKRVRAAVQSWIALLASMFVIPQSAGSWNPARMEYEFQVGAPVGATTRGLTLAARDYAGGRLDWYSFDVVGVHDRERAGTVDQHQAELLPTPLTYPGMPASRFWEIEDHAVSFGNIDAAPEDLARVVVAAYATVYGDDWYVVPLTLPAGRIIQITGVEVLDDFGGRTTIAASATLDGPQRALRFFELTGDPFPDAGGAPLLFVPPVVRSTDAGSPLDAIEIVRDESANLAWAVEHRVEGVYGRGVDPLAAAGGDGPRAAPPPPRAGPAAGEWRFELGGEIPANTVPLLPVRLGADGAIGLQRGRVPLPGSAGTRGALSALLEPAARLIIEESEVPRAGLRVERRYQSARTPAGGLRVWLGRRKGPGRPTGASGFELDRMERHAPPRDAAR